MIFIFITDLIEDVIVVKEKAFKVTLKNNLLFICTIFDLTLKNLWYFMGFFVFKDYTKDVEGFS